MKKLKLITLCILLFSISCTNRSEIVETKDELTFGDLVDLEKLEKVKMSNNYGAFHLSKDQMLDLQKEISEMVYDPNVSVKVGAINIELTINGEIHTISTATQGNYIEVHKDIVSKQKSLIGSSDWLYFKTGEVNFDNYKKEN